ncbi:MAG: hypothetical protein RL726_534 [Actinomycetota bacterium]|jgi:hypothetical protein
MDENLSSEIRDTLPDDLNAVENRAEYRFPDNSRRRIPGIIYLISGALVLVWNMASGDSTTVNDGLVAGAVLLIGIGLFSILSGWRMNIDEQGALTAAGAAVGFPVGHASAQQVWRGIRSRPTWRVLCYSNEDPPLRRGLVLVDAVDGSVKEHFVEENLEQWDEPSR